jgi:hypothetical protein
VPRQWGTVGLLLVVFCACCGVKASAASALSSTPESTYSPTGNVNAVAQLGNTIYLGGNFTQVGPATGTWAALSASTGLVDPASPKFSGASAPSLLPGVFAVVSDGAGGWYVGGNFSSVGGLSRNGLAHIRADMTVDPTWNPNVGGEVKTIAVSDSTVYFGGPLTSVNGSIPRSLAAAVDATTGVATGWNPDPNSDVDALAVSGSTVYMGGAFNTINGSTSRNRAAAVDASTGVASSWNPQIVGGFNVSSIAVSGTTVYLGGNFNTINTNVTRNYAAAVDTSTAAVTSWNPNLFFSQAGGTVNSIIVSGGIVYLGGIFTGVAGGATTRNDLAAVDAITGTATATFDPNVNAGINAMSLSGTTLYLGGGFTTVNGTTARNHLAAVDITTGTATSWNPSADQTVYGLDISGADVGVGGTFVSVNPQARNNLAALDATTGQLTSWNPDADGPVLALLASGSTIYAGGHFANVNGSTARSNLAAFDTTGTGVATGWDPNLSGEVKALALAGTTIYAGGSFSSVNAGNVTRHNVAAFDTTTATATGWDPNAGDIVNALAISGTTVYLGGGFTTINGGTTRNHLAAVDASTGAVTPWDPNANDNTVNALVLSGSTLYAGGDFSTIGATARNQLAAIDTSTGAATAWDPNVAGDFGVESLALSGSTVVAGGVFKTVNGSTPRNDLAAFDATTGLASSWDPEPNGSVDATSVAADGTVYAGGDFTSFPTAPQAYFAAFSPTSDTSPPTITIAAPADGATYTQGAGVNASYTCSDPDGSADVASCTGPVANGAAIDTSTIGAHSFTVSASDIAGNTASRSVSYTVSAPTPITGTSGGTGSAPVSVSPPAISGTPLPTDTLSCSTGTWSNSPTGFSYQWNRGGTPIAGAQTHSYTVQISDEAQSLSCTVTASNSAGHGSPRTSASLLVAFNGTLTCQKPSGRLSGLTLGPLGLGFTRAHAHRSLHRFVVSHNHFDDFCLYAGFGIRAGYPSAQLLRSLPAGQRARVSGKIVLALTANPYYALDGVRPGMGIAATATKLKVGKPFQIGLNTWYIAPGARANGVLKVRGGIIQELGLADKRFTRGPAGQRRFLASFKAA